MARHQGYALLVTLIHSRAWFRGTQGTHIIPLPYPAVQLERVGGLDISFVESPSATSDDADS